MRIATNPKTGERLQFNEATQQWEPQSKPGEDFDFQTGQMFANIPGSAAKLGKDLVAPILHPIDTAKGLGNLAAGVGAKFIPGKQEQEIFADQAGQLLKDRFGSIDNIQRTMQNDPVGFLSDIAGLATGVGGAVGAVGKATGKAALKTAGQAVNKAGRAFDPVGLAARGSAGVIANIPGVQRGTEALMSSAAKFPTTRGSNPTRQAAVNADNVRTALRERVIPNDAGVGKVERRIAEIGDQIDELIDNAPPGTRIKGQPILNTLDEAIDAADIPGDPRAAAEVRRLTKIRKNFIESVGDGDSISVRDAQTVKQRIGQRLNFEKKQGSTTFIRQEGEQAVRRGLRQGLEDNVPGIGELNAKQAALLQLQDPLAQSANAIRRNNAISIQAPLMAGAGAMMGSSMGASGTAAGGAVGAIAGLAQNRGLQARVAVIMQQLIDVGLSPEVAARQAPLLAAQAAKVSGRVGQQEELQ